MGIHTASVSTGEMLASALVPKQAAAPRKQSSAAAACSPAARSRRMQGRMVCPAAAAVVVALDAVSTALVSPAAAVVVVDKHEFHCRADGTQPRRCQRYTSVCNAVGVVFVFLRCMLYHVFADGPTGDENAYFCL